jgi:predicted phosphate transport protein (TIGR00153 family)
MYVGFGIKPKDEKFFDYLIEQVELVKTSADVLHQAIYEHEQLDQQVESIDDLEKQADDIVINISEKLQKTFITPLDREDILTLTQRLDDIVDCVKGIIERMQIYNVMTVSTGAREMAEIVLKAAKQVQKAVCYLPDIKKSHLKISARCSRIVELEAEGDRIYRYEMGKLFRECTDPIEIIKWKEILSNLEELLDMCEDVADSLKRIVLKYA